MENLLEIKIPTKRSYKFHDEDVIRKKINDFLTDNQTEIKNALQGVIKNYRIFNLILKSGIKDIIVKDDFTYLYFINPSEFRTQSYMTTDIEDFKYIICQLLEQENNDNLKKNNNMNKKISFKNFLELYESGNFQKDLTILNESFLHDVITGSDFVEYVTNEFNNRTLIWFDTETSGLNHQKFRHQINQLAAIATSAKVSDRGTCEFPELGSYSQKTKLNQETLDLKNTQHPEDIETKFTKTGRPTKEYAKTMDFVLHMTRYGEHHGDYISEDQMLNDFHQFILEMCEKNGNKPPMLIAQNASFDMEFLSRASEYWKGERIFNDYKVFDTMIMLQKFWVPILFHRMKRNDYQDKNRAWEIKKALGWGFKGLPSVSLGKVAKALNIEPKGWHDARADVDMMIQVTKQAILDIFMNPVSDEELKQLQGPILNKLRSR